MNVSSELKRFQTPVNWGFHSERGKKEEMKEGREKGEGKRKRVEGEREERETNDRQSTFH